MAKRRKIGVTLLIVVVVIVAALVAMRMAEGLNHSPPSLISAKHAQLDALDDMAENAPPPGIDSYNPLVRKQTLRDSGRKGVGLFIRHTFFRIAGGIGFDTDTLSALLVPTHPPRPVTLDDPQSFIFKPLHGSVIMPPRALTAQFNQYLDDYSGAQMRNIKVGTSPNRLTVDGEISNIPGVWLPFHMSGPVQLKQGHLFVYEPDQIKVAKIEAKGLMKLIRLQVSSLVQIDAKGAQLEGDNVVLDLNHALPPPEQDVHVAAMHVDSQGVHLKFTSPFDPKWPQPIIDTDSYVMLDGGDVKTFRALITNVRMQLVAADGGKLDTSLYNYREQIENGHFKATPAGELVAFLAPVKTASYLKPAQPEADDAH